MASQPLLPASRTAVLRRLLKQPGVLQGPCCHDGLSARLIERAGFPFAFMSGFCTAGARLGAPDTGLISYGEMVDTGRNCNEATRSLPIIGDGDTGYGNAMNVKRTVRGYAQAGFAGILIEDQVAPKSCGHVKGKRVTSREEAVARIRAAVDAREEGSDILILARTDARQAVSMSEALWRCEAFADAGADILFIDALETEEEMRRFCWSGGAAARVPKMANMLEGGGKTPILSPQELQDIGYKLVAYPLSLLGVSVTAMENALAGLKQGRVPPPEQLGTFAGLQDAVGFNDYYKEEARYAVSLPSSNPTASTTQTTPTTSATTSEAPRAPPPPPPPPPPPKAAPKPPATPAAEPHAHSSATAHASTTSANPNPNPSSSTASRASSVVVEPTVVEADVVTEPLSVTLVSSASANKEQEDGGSAKRSRFFLVKITEQATGIVKLETRIPSNFLAGLTALVPAVAGINLESMVERAMRDRSREAGGPLVSMQAGPGDLLQVFLEY